MKNNSPERVGELASLPNFAVLTNQEPSQVTRLSEDTLEQLHRRVPSTVH